VNKEEIAMFKRVTVLAVLAFLGYMGTAQAQTPIEIGADNAIGYAITGKIGDVEVADAFFVQLPMTMWRFGFHINETFSIEPGLGFSFLSVTDDGPTSWDLSPTVSVLYNLPSGLFAQLGAGLDISSFDPGGGAESSTTTIFNFGGGVGYRIFMVYRLAIRLSANVRYALESEDDGIPSEIDIFGLFGFSFYTQ
jgi:hypothetical protein